MAGVQERVSNVVLQQERPRWCRQKEGGEQNICLKKEEKA